MEPGDLIEQIAAREKGKKALGRATAQGGAPEALEQRAEPKPSSCLAPDRHPQMDFFVADICDAAVKDDIASMEHPLFALKAGDRRVRRYERNGNSIEIQPSVKGCATIYDKDVWIYAISQLVEAINQGREVSRTLRFTAYNFLVTTNRGISGDSYERMAEALERLSGTRIVTNIETDHQRERAGFGLVDSWRVIERRKDKRMVAVEITLPDWLWRQVRALHVLTLSKDYFRIRKALDRRLYEIARKHCGNQPKWTVSLAVLHAKSGSTGNLKKFRLNVKGLAESNELPDYRLTFDEATDAVTFYARGEKGGQAQIGDLLDGLKPPAAARG